MSRYMLKINKKFGYILVILFFIKPQITEDIQVLDVVFNVARFTISLIYIYFMMFTKKKVNKAWLYLCGIFVCVLISTIRFDGAIEKTLTHYVPALGLLAFISVQRRYIIEILKVTLHLKLVLLVANIEKLNKFINDLEMLDKIIKVERIIK